MEEGSVSSIIEFERQREHWLCEGNAVCLITEARKLIRYQVIPYAEQSVCIWDDEQGTYRHVRRCDLDDILSRSIRSHEVR